MQLLTICYLLVRLLKFNIPEEVYSVSIKTEYCRPFLSETQNFFLASQKNKEGHVN